MPFDVGPLVAMGVLLFLGLVGLTILVPAGIAVKRRSKLAGGIAIAIAGAWAYVYVRPELEAAWRAGAEEECNAQLAALPELFEGRSLLDESAGLSLPVVVQLLTERNLDFVELKPVLMKDGKQRWLKPPGTWDREWTLPTLASPYVRLRLSTAGDPACRSYLNGDRFRSMPPLLPETCFALDEVDSPSAELVLEHEAAGRGVGASYGLHRLIRREPRRVLAQLVTSESAGETVSPSTLNQHHAQCHMPFYVLLDRVRSPATPAEATEGPLLNTRRVKASRSLQELLATGSDWPRLAVAKETYAYLTDEQERAIFAPENSQQAWTETVEAARRQKGASVPFGSTLLDLKSKALIELQGVWRYPWKTHALLDGFFVLKDDMGWDKSAGNLLVRYDREGAFEWAVMVMPPAVQSEQPMAWPQALLVVDQKLVFADRGTGGRSTQWEVPLKMLPPMSSTQGATPGSK